MIFQYTKYINAHSHPNVVKGFKGPIGLVCKTCGTDRWVYDTPTAQRGCIDESEVAVRCMACSNSGRSHSSSWYAQQRLFTLMDRTPKWADRNAILDIYDKCPDGYVVDHIIPLKGKLVSGLHVANNLQYLTPEANTAKSNNY